MAAADTSDTSAANDELTMPIFKNGRYYNPWEGWIERGFGDMFKLMRGTSFLGSVKLDKQELEENLEVLKPDFDKLNNPPKDEIQVSWLGHAAVLVQFDGLSVLTDPVFSQRCSPTQWAGPKRYRPKPCEIDELPKVDAVIISHSHYDHLDIHSVQKLKQKFGSDLHWFVPMKLKKWFTDVGCQNVQELTWWDEATIPGKEDFKFVFTPTQHFSNRSLFDMCRTLWGSWAVIGPKQRFFFGGDTAYCGAFKQIGKKYGPFDFSAIPIGAYDPSWFMSNIHVNPEEAVKIHEDVQSKSSLGIHWGTFVLTVEPVMEPPKRLLEELKKRNIEAEDFFVMKHGEIKTIN